jgi:hypothetical protein
MRLPVNAETAVGVKGAMDGGRGDPRGDPGGERQTR